MIRITYLSEESSPWSPGMLLDLLRHCHINNPKLGLTGLLIHANGSFLQTLEGEEAVVEKLYEKIAADPRHKNVRLVRREAVDRRLYGGWSMGFQRLTDEMLKSTPELKDFVLDDFNPDYLSANPAVVENLLYYHRSEHWDPLVRELDARDGLIRELQNSLAGARQRNEMAALLIESVLGSDAANRLDKGVADLCHGVLASLRSSSPPNIGGGSRGK